MTDAAARLAAALADRYVMERELGQGGMATVYLARDVRHGRPVAIKVLRPELAEALGAERFVREIETTASLRHPHILPLYDSGEAGGFLFYVMPLVEGESLRARLDREKQLPLDDALQIAREVADALSYAHGRGVVHRDIKPENIMLESGHAVVADFGIARAISSAGAQTLTQTGMAVGTPQYMSPEQAAGNKDLDGRSDLYSLGCVLFEMLAGQPPFTGPTVESVVRQHMVANPPPITQLRPAVSAEVAAALQRALAKTPADRFNPVAQFSAALSVGAATRSGGMAAEPAPPEAAGARPSGWSSEVSGPGPGPGSGKRRRRRWLVPLAAVAAVAAVAIAGWLLLAGRGTAPSIRRLAVLPLVNLMADTGQGYFVNGMTDELVSQLGKVGGLDVLSRTSVERFRGSNQSAEEIAAALKVDGLVEGSVFRSGDSVRVTAALIQARPEKQLWSGSYDGALGEALGLQRRVAEAVAAEIGARLIGSARGAAPVRRVDPAAQEAYLHGRIALRTRTLAGMDQAVEDLTAAVRIQPDFADAYGGLAEAEELRAAYHANVWTPAQVRAGRAQARDASLKALQLDSTQAGALSTLGVLKAGDLDWRGAEASLRRAVTLNPSYPQAWNWLGDVLDAVGRHEEAVQARLHAQRLDPLAPVMNRDVGLSLMGAGRYAEALPYLRNAVDIQANVALGSDLLIVCLVQLKRYEEAVAEEEVVLRRLGAGSVVVRQFRTTYAAEGWPAALSWLMGLTRRELPKAVGDPRTFVLAIPGLWRAEALAYLGRTDEALDALERTLADPTVGFVAEWLNTAPWLQPLRTQPRFVALLRKCRLAA